MISAFCDPASTTLEVGKDEDFNLLLIIIFSSANESDFYNVLPISIPD
jgi:hypothetical protein